MLSLQPAVADTRPPAGTPETVSSDPLPAPQIDGVVWDQTVVGNTVYVVGKFETARPAGSNAGVNTVARKNFLAYDLTTGALLPFAPQFNQQARTVAASPDGKRLYVGGLFTQVDGVTRTYIAAFDIATGALVTTFKPNVTRRVNAIVATDTTVYTGGAFTAINSQDRFGAAAFAASNGAMTPWAPAAVGGSVAAMTMSPDGSKIVLGGAFTTVNGSSNPGYGLAAVDTTTGGLLPWAINNLIRNGGEDANINSLASDGTSVYGTGYVFGSGGNLEGTFKADWNGGELQWVEDCHGDSYSVSPADDVVYTAGHAHYCGNVGGFPQTDPWSFYRAIAFTKATTGTLTADPHGYYNFNGTPSPTLLNWFPTFNTGQASGASQGPWDVLVAGKYVLYGGEFTTVNGVRQQGLVRFATKDIAPNDDGPRLNSADFVPNVVSFSRGTARIAWQANHDRDNAELTYTVIRNSQTNNPVYTTTASSNFYTRPLMSFTDTGLTPGATYTYRIRVTDPYGNATQGNLVSVTIAEDGEISDYAQEVLDDNPASFWPLGESSGTVGYDWAAGDDVTLSGTTTRGTAGQDASSPNTATTFGGTDGTFGVSTAVQPGPNTFTAEAWIKTTSTSGGKIIGFGNNRTGDSTSYDRHVYMDNSGRINFGVYTGNTRVVTSGASYNDDQWHHVVASMGPAGMQLYVDSKKVASRADTTAGQAFTGYWRVGGDNVGGWPNQPASKFFAGAIDDVAVYSSVLTRQQIDAHFVASGRASTIPVAPTDAYGASVFALDPTLYYRLGESSGSEAVDSGPFGNPGTYTGLVEKGVTGALRGNADTAARFAPTEEWWGWNEAGVASNATFSNPTTYAVEAWFKTTTTRGGKIVGFGASPTGGSGGYDRHVYMENDGRLTFGTWTGQANTVTSSAAFNDGEWHHVVAQQSNAGMNMFIDGASVGTNPQTGAQDYTGYWRIGGDTTWGGTAPYFAGAIDEVAVYAAPLTSEQVGQHHELGLGIAPNIAPTASFTAGATDLSVALDASASTDPDGTIVSSMWDFGDGTTGTGSTITHSYAEGGTYTVSLLVTDNRGGTATTTREVAVAAPNTAPTASFTATVDDLAGSFDASASSDADGTIASYAWNFGDGETATGATTTHTYGSAGDYLVTLTVTDNRGGTATTTRIVSATVPANQNPTASFTASGSGLTVSVDGSASNDPDGTIASYAWDFGDEGTATGATANHTYAAAGDYTVTLTVTDDTGATAQTTKSVTVAAPPVSSTIAADAFERTGTSAWGTADTGGPWTVTGGASAFSVQGGDGVMTLPAGHTRNARLNQVSVTDVTLAADVATPVVANGGGAYISLVARQVNTAYYSARVRIQNGAVLLQILRSGTVISQSNVPGLAVTPSTTLRLKVEATGTSPTTITTKAWVSGETEPTAWQLSTTDSTAALQSAGQIGATGYISGSTTTGPIPVRFDDFTAVVPGGGVITPPENEAPTASFTATPTELSVAVDASASTDADGSIAGYAWNFGDGATATGATATHSYAAAGTYTVTLTVTDDDGATETTTRSVVVTTPPDAETVAADSFEQRSVTSGWGTSSSGAPWTVGGGASGFSVTNGAGVITNAAGASRSAALNTVSESSTDSVVSFVVPALTTGGGQYVTVVGRQVGSEKYSAVALLTANGTIQLQLARGGTKLQTLNLPGTTYAADSTVTIRVQVFGTAPTTIRAKAWTDAQTEPATWQVSRTDTTAALQTAGTTGLVFYVSGSSTAPGTIRFADYVVKRF
ncbi:PKD domain-containing protein [Labedella populi]|uniref:PKD domain-containing protein n=2 Tax=Labedella populi TaxID=2498850 RepID=A0A3S4DZA6_9MICO|nr:PKD domain-containing protein [Labedella populi]